MYRGTIFILVGLVVLLEGQLLEVPEVQKSASFKIARSKFDDIPLVRGNGFICFVHAEVVTTLKWTIFRFQNNSFGSEDQITGSYTRGQTITHVRANAYGSNHEKAVIVFQQQSDLNVYALEIDPFTGESASYQIPSPSFPFTIVASVSTYTFTDLARTAIGLVTNNAFTVQLLNFKAGNLTQLASISIDPDFKAARMTHFPALDSARLGYIVSAILTNDGSLILQNVFQNGDSVSSVTSGIQAIDITFEGYGMNNYIKVTHSPGGLAGSRVLWEGDVLDETAETSVTADFPPGLLNILIRPNVLDTVDYGSFFISLPENSTHQALWEFGKNAPNRTFVYKPEVPNLASIFISPVHDTTFVTYYTDLASESVFVDFHVFDVCGDLFLSGSEQCVPGSIGCLENCTCSTDFYRPFSTPQADCAPTPGLTANIILMRYLCDILVCTDDVLVENECRIGNEGCSNTTCTCLSGYDLGTNGTCSLILVPEAVVPASEPSGAIINPPADSIRLEVIIPSIVVPVVVVIGVGVFLIIYFLRRQKKHTIASINMENIAKYATIEDRMSVPYKQIKFLNEIGSGAFGRVYIGEWQKTKVAIKVNTTGQTEDFISEARLMINMRPHPNIVQILGVSVDGPHLVMIIEFCDGGSLDRLLFDTNTPVNVEQQYQFAFAIAKGMLHLHTNGLVHRDLAARNILLNKGTPKISDFGMSRMLQEVKQGTTRTNIGPVRWMSPESLKHNSYSKMSDVWSYGVVLYEITARQEPHTNVDIFDIVPKIRDVGATPQIEANTDPFLADLMKKCWHFNEDARPSFDVICDLLESHMTEKGINTHMY